MKIVNTTTGVEVDAPTHDEFEKRYFGDFPKDMLTACRCGWEGFRGDLEHEVDLEIMHPKNRHNPSCTFSDRTGCHYTAFEKCPRCKRCVFSDGARIQP